MNHEFTDHEERDRALVAGSVDDPSYRDAQPAPPDECESEELTMFDAIRPASPLRLQDDWSR